METSVVALFPTRHEGELARGFLDRAQVPAALLADDAGGAEAGLTFVNPARLMVRAEDEEVARAILLDAGYGEVLTGSLSAEAERANDPKSG